MGHSLSQKLLEEGYRVVCTTSRDTAGLAEKIKSISPGPTTGGSVSFAQVRSSDDAERLIDRRRPNVVMNLRIGIGRDDFKLHQAAAHAIEKLDGHYVYSSSALALDGHDFSTSLTEDVPAVSNSAYGQFKGRCEGDIGLRTNLRALVLRFSSIHGWSPWKDTRTVSLLKRVAAGEQIQVNPGIIQNRLSDRLLAETICFLICKGETGIAHIGTVDSSEEIAFLKRLARNFGLPDENITLGGESRLINLAVVPEKGLHPSGNKTETETIADLCNREELASYKASQSHH